MLRVALATSPIGQVTFPPTRDHVIRIHAGPPVRASCRTRRYQYTRDDIDIVPAGTAGTWTSEDPATTLAIALAPHLVHRAAEQLGLDPARVTVTPRHQVRDPRIAHVASALEAEDRAGYPGGRAFADTLVLALAVHVLGEYRAPVRSGTELAPAQLARLADYIEAHLDRELSLAKLAGVLAISASHLKATFKRSTGLAVHEYIVLRRVARARQLLAAGDLPASQVALAAGFSHQSHMARWMRRLLGRTPSMLGSKRR